MPSRPYRCCCQIMRNKEFKLHRTACSEREHNDSTLDYMQIQSSHLCHDDDEKNKK